MRGSRARLSGGKDGRRNRKRLTIEVISTETEGIIETVSFKGEKFRESAADGEKWLDKHYPTNDVYERQESNRHVVWVIFICFVFFAFVGLFFCLGG